MQVEWRWHTMHPCSKEPLSHKHIQCNCLWKACNSSRSHLPNHCCAKLQNFWIFPPRALWNCSKHSDFGAFVHHICGALVVATPWNYHCCRCLMNLCWSLVLRSGQGIIVPKWYFVKHFDCPPAAATCETCGAVREKERLLLGGRTTPRSPCGGVGFIPFVLADQLLAWPCPNEDHHPHQGKKEWWECHPNQAHSNHQPPGGTCGTCWPSTGVERRGKQKKQWNMPMSTTHEHNQV